MPNVAEPNGTFVSLSDIEHYRRHGFVVLRNVIPISLREDAIRIIEPWVAHWTQQWGDAGDAGAAPDECFRRLLLAWRAAGRPHFRRRPNSFLINAEMYAFLRSTHLLSIAEQILGTAELSVQGIFNARPQMPHCSDTMTPFHQDAQYWRLDYGSAPDFIGDHHAMTMWIPLQHVDSDSGALGVISAQDIDARMIEPFDYGYERTGFLGIAPELVAQHTVIPVCMNAGDALIFSQLTPHGALRNIQDRIRWSIDIRYEATAHATSYGQRFGFIAQSYADPASVTPLAAWIRKGQCHSRL